MSILEDAETDDNIEDILNWLPDDVLQAVLEACWGAAGALLGGEREVVREFGRLGGRLFAREGGGGAVGGGRWHGFGE